MEFYFLNSNEQPPESSTHKHEHELHRVDCPFFPDESEKFGPYKTSQEALLAARIWTSMKGYDWFVDGCAECCPEIDSDKQ